ncbi:MAG TPA: hypothetical protein VGI82_10680, partial [Chitinophagaceae bacterium]
MKAPIIFASVLLGSVFFNNSSRSTSNSLPAGAKRTSAENAKILPVGTIYIIIDKSDYELNVYDSKGWYATYPVVFGNNSLDDKKMEG